MQVNAIWKYNYQIYYIYINTICWYINFMRDYFI